jgi:hypothetical protein
MRKLKQFFNKRNATGILVSGLAGFLVLSMTGLGDRILAYYNQLMRK